MLATMRTAITVAILLFSLSSAGAEYLGDLPPGQRPPEVFTNPYASSPQLYDSRGRYRGNLGNNPYDPDRVTNPSGRHGSPYSPYRQDSVALSTGASRIG